MRNIEDWEIKSKIETMSKSERPELLLWNWVKQEAITYRQFNGIINYFYKKEEK